MEMLMTAMEHGWLGSALAEFKVAGVEPPRDRFVECGNAVLDKGWGVDALKAFEAAGGVDRDKLIASAQACLEGGWINDALRGDRAAGLDIPRDKLIAYGKACVAKGATGNAIEALEAAG